LLIDRGISKRRACRLIGVARTALAYETKVDAKDVSVIEAMKRLSGLSPRYGYRKIRVFLGPEGFEISPGRAEWLWRKAKLQLPVKRRRKRILSSRPRPIPPWAANHVWAYDFVFDACANGQQIK
jgi:putative transposase